MRTNPSARRMRGAATTEFALAMLLIIPVIVYSIYVGEAFLAGIKAEEAEINAGWDVTAYRLHDFSGSGGAALTKQLAAQRSAARVLAEMRDFDSYGGSGANGRDQVFSHLTLDLRCDVQNAPAELRSFSTFDQMPNAAGVTSRLDPAGNVFRCKAHTTFENRAAPARFLQEFSRVEMLKPAITRFDICGLGETLNGCDPNRDNGFTVLGDDWGLENGASVMPTSSGSATNPAYWAVGEAVYQFAGTPISGQQVAEAREFFFDQHDDPADTAKFRLGYRADVDADHIVDTHAGPETTHLTPWKDSDPTGRISTSRDVYQDRRGANYLGHPLAGFNDP